MLLLTDACGRYIYSLFMVQYITYVIKNLGLCKTYVIQQTRGRIHPHPVSEHIFLTIYMLGVLKGKHCV